MKMNANFNWEVDQVNNTNDIIRLTLAILAAIKMVIASFGYTFFTDDLLLALENLIPLLIILWGIWRNNYVSKQGKAQKAVLMKHDLAKKELL